MEQIEQEQKERKDWNNQQLQKLLGHATPNLGEYGDHKGKIKEWIAANPGKTEEHYKNEIMYKQVQTWG